MKSEAAGMLVICHVHRQACTETTWEVLTRGNVSVTQEAFCKVSLALSLVQQLSHINHSLNVSKKIKIHGTGTHIVKFNGIPKQTLNVTPIASYAQQPIYFDIIEF